jgi:hypothetical protein
MHDERQTHSGEEGSARASERKDSYRAPIP